MNRKLLQKTYKYLIIIFLMTLLLAQFFQPQILADEITQNAQTAIATNQDINLYSRADILLDAKTGNILYENNSNEKLFPASTTKLMTAILTVENCDFTDTVTIKQEWLSGIPSSYTTAALQPGETLTVNQLMHVLLIPSANDAANVLACHISGSVEKFANKMNEKAKDLGCKNTHFVNPSGIHNDNHYSTAYDMAQIGLYASKYSKIREIAKTSSYSLPAYTKDDKKIERNFKSTNTLINPKSQYAYEYATGLKTGYTDKAKSCIVATAKKDDIELLCVVLGGDKTEDNKAQRELDCRAMFEYGFNNYKYVNICEKNGIVDLSGVDNVPSYLSGKSVVYGDTLNVLVLNNSIPSSTVLFETDKKMPIMKDTTIGTITYTLQGKQYTINILAGEDILPTHLENTKIIYYVLIALLVLLIIFTIFKTKKRKQKSIKYFRHSFY